MLVPKSPGISIGSYEIHRGEKQELTLIAFLSFSLPSSALEYIQESGLFNGVDERGCEKLIPLLNHSQSKKYNVVDTSKYGKIV